MAQAPTTSGFACTAFLKAGSKRPSCGRWREAGQRALLVAWTFIALLLPREGPAACGDAALSVQVLGSGGPEIEDGRASSAYLVWLDGRARLLVDAGGGSALRFAEAQARFADLDGVLLTHLHVDHSADIPVYVKSSYFSDRSEPLSVYGPTGNRTMPALTDFLAGLFGEDSRVYRYLSDFLGQDGTAGYVLQPVEVEAAGREKEQIAGPRHMQLSAVPVHHGPVPALAWRVDVRGKAVVFSGDMNGDYDTLPSLARDADLLVAHHAIPEGATGAARALHMPPSVIGTIAGKAQVDQLVLSHRMLRTLGREAAALEQIRRHYQGPVEFADDLDCFVP